MTERPSPLATARAALAESRAALAAAGPALERLRAEVDRLRAEVDRLHADLAERDRADAPGDRLGRRIGRIEAAGRERGDGRPLAAKAAELRARLEKQTAAKHRRIDRTPDRLARARDERHAELKDEHEADARHLADGHEFDRGAQAVDFRATRKAIREDQRHEKRSLRDERRELIEWVRQELKDAGFARRKRGEAALDAAREERRAQRGGATHDRGILGIGELRSEDGGDDQDSARDASVHRGREGNLYRVREKIRPLRGGRGDAGRRPEDHVRPHRLPPGRTHKASSDESILRHCARRLGLWRRWKRGELTDAERLTLADAVREYARAWLRHEAEAFLAHYGREIGDADGSRGASDGRTAPAGADQRGDLAGVLRDVGDDREADVAIRSGDGHLAHDDPAEDQVSCAAEVEELSDGGPGNRGDGHVRDNDLVRDLLDQVGIGTPASAPSEVSRALSAPLRHAASRFFDRVKTFLKEAIIAGAMAMNGPEPLDEHDLAEVDRQHAVQVGFLDRFRDDVAHFRTPAEIAAEPSGPALANPMTAAQFAKRASDYAGAVWVGAQAVNRAAVIRGGKAVAEARFHRLPNPEGHACSVCLGESEKGWVPVGTLLPVGDSACLGVHCDCYFSFKLADGSIFITARGWERAA